MKHSRIIDVMFGICLGFAFCILLQKALTNTNVECNLNKQIQLIPIVIDASINEEQ